MSRLDTCSANVAEGSGEHIPAILGLRGMSTMRTILILEQGHDKMVIPGSEMHKLLLGKGARVLDLMKTPSGHLVIKVDECGTAAEDKSSIACAITANPHCEDAALHVQEAADTEPTAGQPASSSAGAPATNNAHAYM
eukprot:6556417-Pyramimonas_sp.AAC.1